MSRAGIGTRRHGGDVSGFQNKKSGRCGSAAAGRYIENDGNGGGRDLLDNLPGRLEEASGRIDLDQYSLSVAALRFVDGAGNIFFGNRLNGVVDDNLKNFSARDATQNQNGRKAE